MVGVRLIKLLLERMMLATIGQRFIEGEKAIVIGVSRVELRLRSSGTRNVPLGPGYYADLLLVDAFVDLGDKVIACFIRAQLAVVVLIGLSETFVCGWRAGGGGGGFAGGERS